MGGLNKLPAKSSSINRRWKFAKAGFQVSEVITPVLIAAVGLRFFLSHVAVKIEIVARIAVNWHG